MLSAHVLGKLYPSIVLHRLAAAMFAGELNFIVPVGGLDRSYSHGHETFGADEMPHECRRLRLAGLGIATYSIKKVCLSA